MKSSVFVMPKTVWVNGKWLDPRRPALSVFDRGFMNGEGVFETFRAYAGKIFRHDAHHERLRRSAAGIKLRVPVNKARLRRTLEELLRRNRLREAVVRITLTRGPGPRGYDPRPCPTPTLAAVALPAPDRPSSLYRKGALIALARTRRYPKTALDPSIKSICTLNNAFAFWEGMKHDAIEAIMLNTEGFLTEGTASNLFWVRHGRLRTASLDCGLLAGVTRGLVLTLARAEGIPVDQGRYRPRDLMEADEVFLTGTTLEVMPVTRIADESGRIHTVGDGEAGPLSARLHARYRRLVTRETGRTF